MHKTDPEQVEFGRTENVALFRGGVLIASDLAIRPARNQRASKWIGLIDPIHRVASEHRVSRRNQIVHAPQEISFRSAQAGCFGEGRITSEVWGRSGRLRI